MLLLQVNGSLAEVTARTAAQAWRCRDVISSLGAVQLIHMLDFAGEHASRASNHAPTVMLSVACTTPLEHCSLQLVHVHVHVHTLTACKPMSFNAHTRNAAQLLLGAVSFAMVAQVASYARHVVLASLSQHLLSVSMASMPVVLCSTK